MQGALIILAATIVAGILLRVFHRPDAPATDAPAPSEEPAPAAPEETEECCGVHAICEKQMTLLDTGHDYYDDEELDRFRRRDPSSYTPAEVEEFRDVMLTMQPREVYGWASALTRRDIPFPTELRPELLLLISEADA